MVQRSIVVLGMALSACSPPFEAALLELGDAAGPGEAGAIPPDQVVATPDVKSSVDDSAADGRRDATDGAVSVVDTAPDRPMGLDAAVAETSLIDRVTPPSETSTPPTDGGAVFPDVSSSVDGAGDASRDPCEDLGDAKTYLYCFDTERVWHVSMNCCAGTPPSADAATWVRCPVFRSVDGSKVYRVGGLAGCKGHGPGGEPPFVPEGSYCCSEGWTADGGPY